MSTAAATTSEVDTGALPAKPAKVRGKRVEPLRRAAVEPESRGVGVAIYVNAWKRMQHDLCIARRGNLDGAVPEIGRDRAGGRDHSRLECHLAIVAVDVYPPTLGKTALTVARDGFADRLVNSQSWYVENDRPEP